MNKTAKNHLLIRFILLFNIVFIAITIIFLILVNNWVLGLQIPPTLRQTLNKINTLIFFFSFIIILFNAYLLINHLFYNTKQYFKLAEKIDFNDLATTIGIINNLPSIDEYGDLGKNVTKLLRVYVNYANLMRKRLVYQDKKIKILIEQAKIPLMIFERDPETKIHNLSSVSPTARILLGLESSSAIVGKPVSALFSKETTTYLQNLVSQNPREIPSSQLTILGTVEWKASVEKEAKDTPPLSLDVSIIPFVFQFPDDYQYQDPKANPSNFNTIVDTFFLLILPKETNKEKGLDPLPPSPPEISMPTPSEA